MAKRKNRKQDNIEEEVLVEQLEQKERSTSDFLEDNQKTIIGVLLGAAILIGAWFAYSNLVQKPKMTEAAYQLSQAQSQFEQDSFTNALSNPGGGYPGFLDIIDQYGSTPAGNSAKYYAGVSYLHLGDFDKAIDYLKDFSPAGSVMPAMKNGALGDAYSEKQDFSNAISYYAKASNATTNEFVAAEYYKKLGMLYEKQQDYKNALTTFQTLKEKYPNSVAGKEVEKLIARVSSLLN